MIPRSLCDLLRDLIYAYEHDDDYHKDVRRLEAYCVDQGIVPRWDDDAGDFETPDGRAVKVVRCEQGSIDPKGSDGTLTWRRREYGGVDTVRLMVRTDKLGWFLVDVPWRTLEEVRQDVCMRGCGR